jgi:hypothetical protein
MRRRARKRLNREENLEEHLDEIIKKVIRTYLRPRGKNLCKIKKYTDAKDFGFIKHKKSGEFHIVSGENVLCNRKIDEDNVENFITSLKDVILQEVKLKKTEIYEERIECIIREIIAIFQNVGIDICANCVAKLYR